MLHGPLGVAFPLWRLLANCVRLPFWVHLRVNFVLLFVRVVSVVHRLMHRLVHRLLMSAAGVGTLMHGSWCHVLDVVVRVLVDMLRHVLGMHVGSWVVLLPLGDMALWPLNLPVALVGEIAHLGIGLVRLHLGVPCLLFASGLLHLHVTRRHVVAVRIFRADDVLVMLWGSSERLAVNCVCSHCASCARLLSQNIKKLFNLTPKFKSLAQK